MAKKTIHHFRPTTLTADAALYGSLGLLVAQARQLERTTPLGRAVVDAMAAELVGTGISINPSTDDAGLNQRLQDRFNTWADHAMVDGSSLWNWQRAGARELATAGAVLARVLIRPERVARGWLPVCLLPLEVEWFSVMPIKEIPSNHAFFRGIELDELGLPFAYHLRHPHAPTGGERIPAAEIIHVFEKRRPQQNHGEPILAPVIERILQDSRLVEAELAAAMATTAPACAITTSGADLPENGEDDDDDDPQIDFTAGSVARLLPGESITPIKNERATQDLGPFRREIRSDVAAACRVSSWWLDRDPSRANYSSMRMDQLLSKRATTGLKDILGTGTAGRPYELALPWICLELGLGKPAPAMAAYDLAPDQPEYVDPYKDVLASTMAIAAGLSTYEYELASRGKDRRKVFEKLAAEKAELEALGLAFPTIPKPKPQMEPPAGDEAAEAADEAGLEKKTGAA